MKRQPTSTTTQLTRAYYAIGTGLGVDQDWSRVDEEQATIFGESKQEMIASLLSLGLLETAAKELFYNAAYWACRKRRALDQHKVPPAQSRQELTALASSLRRARKALVSMGDLGRYRLVRFLPTGTDEWPFLEQFTADLHTLEEAAILASDEPPNWCLPEGPQELARWKKRLVIGLLRDLDATFESYAGHRPPRSEYTAGTPYPWFLFCKLAAAPLGAPQSNEGFRRLFRLAVKVAQKNDEVRP